MRSGKTRHVIFNHPTLRIFRNIAVCTIEVYGLSPHNVLITMTMDIDEVRAEAKCDDVEEFKDGAKDDNISSRKRTTSQACMEMIAMMEAQKRESEELKKEVIALRAESMELHCKLDEVVGKQMYQQEFLKKVRCNFPHSSLHDAKLTSTQTFKYLSGTRYWKEN